MKGEFDTFVCERCELEHDRRLESVVDGVCVECADIVDKECPKCGGHGLVPAFPGGSIIDSARRVVCSKCYGSGRRDVAE